MYYVVAQVQKITRILCVDTNAKMNEKGILRLGIGRDRYFVYWSLLGGKKKFHKSTRPLSNQCRARYVCLFLR